MKKEITRTSLTIIVLVTISFIGTSITLGNTGLDIQLHDTYFVFDPFTTTLLIATALVEFTFLAKGIMARFKTIGTNLGNIAGLILLIYSSRILIVFGWAGAWKLILVEVGFGIFLTIRTYKLIRIKQ